MGQWLRFGELRACSVSLLPKVLAHPAVRRRIICALVLRRFQGMKGKLGGLLTDSKQRLADSKQKLQQSKLLNESRAAAKHLLAGEQACHVKKSAVVQHHCVVFDESVGAMATTSETLLAPMTLLTRCLTHQQCCLQQPTASTSASGGLFRHPAISMCAYLLLPLLHTASVCA